MARKQPKRLRTPGDDMRIATQAQMRGPQPTRVRGYPAAVAPQGEPYIVIQVNRSLFYIYDRKALTTMVKAFDYAATLADDVFGPEEEWTRPRMVAGSRHP